MAKTQRRTRRKRTYRSKRPKHTRKRTRMSRKRTRRRKQRGGAGVGVSSLFVKGKKTIVVTPPTPPPEIYYSEGPYVIIRGKAAIWEQAFSKNKRFLRVFSEVQGTRQTSRETSEDTTLDEMIGETDSLIDVEELSKPEFEYRYYAIEAVVDKSACSAILHLPSDIGDIFGVKIKEIQPRGKIREGHLYLDDFYPGDIGEIKSGQKCDLLEMGLVTVPSIKFGKENYKVKIKSGGSDSTVFLVEKSECVVKEYVLQSSKKIESDVLNEFKRRMETTEYSAILPEIYEKNQHESLSSIKNYIIERVDLNRCIVMEYLQDIRESDMTNSGPLLTFVNGLNALHTSGCYHLDIKPGNLKIRKNPDSTDTFVLIDFDQSKSLNDKTSVVADGGTPAYTYFHYNAGFPASSETLRCQDYFGFTQTLCTFILGSGAARGQGEGCLLEKFLERQIANMFGWASLSHIMDNFRKIDFTPDELTFITNYALPPFFKDPESDGILEESALSPRYCEWFQSNHRGMIEFFCKKMSFMQRSVRVVNRRLKKRKIVETGIPVDSPHISQPPPHPSQPPPQGDTE